MPDELVKPPNRSDLRRALVVNALTKPLNIVVPAAVVVAGLVIGTLWLVVVAVAVYVILVAMTFFDADEAKRVGDEAYGRHRLTERSGRPQPAQLSKPIGEQLAAALTEEQRIRGAIAEAELPFADVGPEVDALVQAMERICKRADLVYRYLADQNPAAVEQRLAQVRGEAGKAPEAAQRQLIDALTQQLEAQRALEDQLKRFYGQMEHTVTSLGAISARIVQASVAEEDAAQSEVAGQVRDLREQAVGLAEGMKEAYTRTDELDELDELPRPQGAA